MIKQCSTGRYKEEDCTPEHQSTKISRSQVVKSFMCSTHQQRIYLFPKNIQMVVLWEDGTMDTKDIPS
jgi:hypothetical protein